MQRNNRGKHRNMLKITGKPGWLRFGYQKNRSQMGPCAQYLMQTGQYDNFVSSFHTSDNFEDEEINHNRLNWNFSKSDTPKELKKKIDELELEIKDLKHKLKKY